MIKSFILRRMGGFILRRLELSEENKKGIEHAHAEIRAGKCHTFEKSKIFTVFH